VREIVLKFTIEGELIVGLTERKVVTELEGREEEEVLVEFVATTVNV
jgi:hypothetical protein